MRKKTLNKFFNLFLSLFVLSLVEFSSAQDVSTPVRYGYGLPETGSDKSAFTIYTNPGEDCSTSMNISWATPPGTPWMIEVTDEEYNETYIYEYNGTPLGVKNNPDAGPNGEPYEFPTLYRCETFNNIPSKLSDRSSVTEKHIFDKHGCVLYDLYPNTDYSYRIVTLNDSTGQQEYSDTYRFRTAGDKYWKAAIVGDFHHYSPLWKRLDSVMGMLDVLDSVSGGFDWVLSPGDQCAYGGSYNFWTELSEQPNFKNYMWASVQGNHDNMAANKKKSDNFFRDSHFFPTNGYKGQEGISYWFKYGDALFLMLNNEAMHTQDGKQDAIDWMKKVVKENPSKYLIVVEHYQWLLDKPDSPSNQLLRFYDTFDELGVDLAISGHNHVYRRTYPLDNKEVVEPDEGTYYVGIASSDNERGRDFTNTNNYMLEKRWTEGPKTVSGMLMDVGPERIKMTLYDRYGQEHDSFIVPAKR